MGHRSLLAALPGAVILWLLSFSPGCEGPVAPPENQEWWEDVVAGSNPGIDGAGLDDGWVDFADGGDYADDLDDYYDHGY